MKFHIISCHVLWRELTHYASQSKNIFNFQFLKQGLHDTPEILRRDLQKAIDSVEGEYDAILIGYGLCSVGLEGITARNTKLVVMRGHDCITFLLGSKEKYKEIFDKYPGTYWYSPGWIELGYVPGEDGYQNKSKKYIERYGQENAEYLMSLDEAWCKNYTRCTYVDLGFSPMEEYKKYTQKCADWLGWECNTITGDPNLIINFLEGNWNEENYLIVHPGEKIISSHDEKIIEAVKG